MQAQPQPTPLMQGLPPPNMNQPPPKMVRTNILTSSRQSIVQFIGKLPLFTNNHKYLLFIHYSYRTCGLRRRQRTRSLIIIIQWRVKQLGRNLTVLTLKWWRSQSSKRTPSKTWSRWNSSLTWLILRRWGKLDDDWWKDLWTNQQITFSMAPPSLIDPGQQIPNQMPFVPQFNASVSPFMHPPFTAPPAAWNNWQAHAPHDPSKMFNDSKLDPKILAKASEWTEHRAPDGRPYYYRFVESPFEHFPVVNRSSFQCITWRKHLGTSAGFERIGWSSCSIDAINSTSQPSEPNFDDDAR